MPDTLVLLRGVNVGGHRTLKMAELRDVVAGLGHRGVRSLIQSGNLVFDRAVEDLDSVARGVERAILDASGVTTVAVVRDRGRWLELAAEHPFFDHASALNKLHVTFLSELPPATAGLDPADFLPEELVLRGQELYLHLPSGMGRTRLNQAFLDRRLGVKGTTRNWRTVQRLATMVQEPPANP